MSAVAAVRIDNDLPAGESAVSNWSSDNESSRWVDKVAGGFGKTGPLGLGNQPISQVTRFLHEWKLPGKDLGEGAQAAWRRSRGTYADNPKAQNLYEDITNNRVEILANKVLEMSGKAATDQERAFLNIPMPHITDDPRILVNQTLRKALRALAARRDAGLACGSVDGAAAIVR